MTVVIISVPNLFCERREEIIHSQSINHEASDEPRVASEHKRY